MNIVCICFISPEDNKKRFVGNISYYSMDFVLKLMNRDFMNTSICSNELSCCLDAICNDDKQD